MSEGQELDADRNRPNQQTSEADSTRHEPMLIVEEPIVSESVPIDQPPPTARETPGLWKANPTLLGCIVDLGFSAICAEKALFHTGNSSADRAVGWILDHPDCQDDPTPLRIEALPVSSESSSLESVDMYKMVFVVNSSLKMGLGKIAAQVGHATLSLYKRLEAGSFSEALRNWSDSSEMKIVLRGEDEQHLINLLEAARTAGLASYLVRDAGHTQVPSGSATVLSIFGASQQLDAITGNLKLI